MMLGLGLGLGVRARSGVAPFSPASLFAAGEKGMWYDVSDMSTMFQDSAGTTPVTAVEQPVGKWLDKSGSGNHLLQATGGNMPILSAKKNYVLSSDDLSRAAWTKSDVGAVGNAFGNYSSITENNVNAQHFVSNTGAFPVFVGTPVLASFKLKAGERTKVMVAFTNAASWSGGVVPSAIYDLTAGTVGSFTGGASGSITALGSGEFFCTLMASPTVSGGTTAMRVYLLDGAGASTYQGISGNKAYIAEPQVELGPTVTRYQRYNTPADYDSVGFPRFVKFDGINDYMQSALVALGSPSQIAIAAGIRHTSNAIPYFLTEYSANVGTNAGSFYLTTPEGAAGEFAIYRNVGGNAAGYMSGANGQFQDKIIGAYIDLAGTTLATEIPIYRLNRVDARTTPIGTYANTAGTFGDYILNVGARAGVAYPTDGRFFGMIIRAAPTTAQQITNMEGYIASTGGVTL